MPLIVLLNTDSRSAAEVVALLLNASETELAGHAKAVRDRLTELAQKLGISRKSLWERRQRLGIPRRKSTRR